MSTPKEPEFFARDDIYQKGESWYASLFQEAQAGQKCGEASTLYTLTSHFPETVRRMHHTVPNAKLIYVVREPVERAYSYYAQIVKNYQRATHDFSVNRTFEECLFPEKFSNIAPREKFFAPFDHHLPDAPSLYTDGSHYAKQLQEYLKYYPKEQILLVKFSDLMGDTEQTLKTICQYIGVNDSTDLINEQEVQANIAANYYSEAERTSTAIQLKQNPVVKAVSRVAPKTVRTLALNVITAVRSQKNKSPLQPKKMEDETRAYLNRELEDEIIKAESMLK